MLTNCLGKGGKLVQPHWKTSGRTRYSWPHASHVYTCLGCSGTMSPKLNWNFWISQNSPPHVIPGQGWPHEKFGCNLADEEGVGRLVEGGVPLWFGVENCGKRGCRLLHMWPCALACLWATCTTGIWWDQHRLHWGLLSHEWLSLLFRSQACWAEVQERQKLQPHTPQQAEPYL